MQSSHLCAVEKRAWHLLWKRSLNLRHLRLFSFTTGGYVCTDGILLPIQAEGKELMISFFWGRKGPGEIFVHGNHEVVEKFQRTWWLRQAIKLLGVAAQMVERKSASETRGWSWRDLACKQCGSLLKHHIQPGYVCPPIAPSVLDWSSTSLSS